ncbi:hypothetical protein HF1_10660 [Mycoplasma haemofelis str. Langford 1]|uniref:Uncharacterized protein n=1 Tax=Mycoplasma haemofelis (strain Langford 1) TaxID=941640 RepID=E8ZIV3_MYCHL|nr:hypothetical protein [Mycoplasma haemofelis]CBY93074.1 hypothetical protein HF1_10660 [Mycoplasma haemofelis str. Langford 1]
MTSGLLKFAALSGVGAAGGGIAASSSMFSGSKGESVTYKTTSSKVTEDSSDLSIPEAPEEQKDEASTVARKCVIFETDEATGSGDQMKITKILKRYDDRNQFLAGITNNGDANFKRDVGDACDGKKPNNHPSDKDVTIYVYKKQKDGLWNYTQFLQKRDWAKDSAIKQNSSEVNLD